MKSNVAFSGNLQSVLISISVKPKYYASILLIIVLLLSILPIFSLAINRIDEDSVFVVITMTVLLILFPLKYCLWNVFGKETLLINQKSLSYQYNCGFISNNLTTLPFKNLKISFENILVDKTQKFGKMYFYEENDNTGLLKLFHHTSIYMSEENFDEILSEIEKLFYFEDFSKN